MEPFRADQDEYVSPPRAEKKKGANRRNDIIQQVEKTPKREQSSKTSRRKSEHPDGQS